MSCTNRKYLLLLYICSSIALASCQTNTVDETEQDLVPKKQWATFPALSQKNYAKDFPSSVRVTSINGQKVADIHKRRDERLDCSKRPCKLHPGSHTIGFTYVWSQTETKEMQRSKSIGSGMLGIVGAVAGILGGGDIPDSAAFPLENSHCKQTMTFEAQATRGYVLYAVHAVQKEQPEEFQILDAESGVRVASASPSCEVLYETAFAFSNESASDDQCVIHLFMGKDARLDRVQFDLDGSDSFSARGRMAYSFTVEPGKHQISASVIYNPALLSEHNVEKGQIRCDVGETKYVQMEVEGFWTSRLVITEISIEEVQALISKVASKSKLHEMVVP